MSETEQPQQGKIGWTPIVLGSLVFTGLFELVGRQWKVGTRLVQRQLWLSWG